MVTKSMSEALERLRGMRGNHACYEDLVDECCDIADEIQRELDEGFVALPTDEDGKLIHLWDVMLNLDGMRTMVIGVGSDLYFWQDDDLSIHAEVAQRRHHYKMTVEDVLTECCSRYYDSMVELDSGIPFCTPTKDIVAKFAEKLRLADDE